MPFNLAQFTLQKAVLEIRYAHVFLLWDRSGSIWQNVQRVHPGLKVRTAQPNQIIIDVSENTEAFVGIDKAYITTFFPGTDLKSIKDLAKELFSALFEALEIADLSRIGLRLVFEQIFKERDAAALAVLENTRLPTFKGKYFNIEGKLLDPDLAARWEGDKTGCSVRAQVLQQKLDVEMPKEFKELKPIHFEQTKVVLDVDYYVHASTAVSKFEPVTLINEWSHAIRRDIAGFLNG